MRKTAIILFLTLCLLISAMPLSAFAEETMEPVNEDPVDENIEPHHCEAFYTYLDNSQHQVKVYWYYIDTMTGTVFLTSMLAREYLDRHSVSSYSYSGNNYHSGTRHYFEYSGYCTRCGGLITKWESAACPGNGNCIAPFSVEPITE